MKSLSCPNRECSISGKTVVGNIIRFGFYKTRRGKRRRFQCQACHKTFCSNTATPYYRLQHRRTAFDEVVTLSVEGLNKSAIARVQRIAWNTVDRWLEKAGDRARRFNDQEMATLHGREFQADEIRTIVRSKQQPIWVFAAIEVWSRLWASTVVGRRSYQNTLALFQDVAKRMNLEHIPLIATDGFKFYEKVIGQVFGAACAYGQVIKTRRNNRIVKVDRRAVIGTVRRLEERLQESEDSSKLNTSFVERLNLTIRQGSAYLCRRTICHARWKERLAGHLELLRCYYNFVRPHRALKFGREVRTPAVQAGLTKRRLTFREIFSSRMVSLASGKVVFVFIYSTIFVIVDERVTLLAHNNI
jgi:transposase-like protein/IS1 family transposase